MPFCACAFSVAAFRGTPSEVLSGSPCGPKGVGKGPRHKLRGPRVLLPDLFVARSSATLLFSWKKNKTRTIERFQGQRRSDWSLAPGESPLDGQEVQTHLPRAVGTGYGTARHLARKGRKGVWAVWPDFCSELEAGGPRMTFEGGLMYLFASWGHLMTTCSHAGNTQCESGARPSLAPPPRTSRHFP